MARALLINGCLFLLLWLGGCTTVPKALHEVKPGWNKADVVERAGNPSHTYRKDSIDHWIYKYYEGDRLKSTEIQFQGGKVIDVGPASSSHGPASEEERLEYKKGLEQNREKFEDLK